MKFSKRIKEVIENSKYSQKEIAKMLNISEGNITNWKKGGNLPSITILYKLCLLLNESADYLLGLEDESGTKIIKSNQINDNFNNNNGNINFKM